MAIHQIVEFLLVDSFTTLGESLDVARLESFSDAESDPEAEWQPWLRTFASRRIEYGEKFNSELVVKRTVFHQLFELNSSLRSAVISSNDKGQSLPKGSELPAARIVNQQIDC